MFPAELVFFFFFFNKIPFSLETMSDKQALFLASYCTDNFSGKMAKIKLLFLKIWQHLLSVINLDLSDEN